MKNQNLKNPPNEWVPNERFAYVSSVLEAGKGTHSVNSFKNSLKFAHSNWVKSKL